MYGNKTYNDRYAVWHPVYKSTNIVLGGGTAYATFSNVFRSNNGIYGSPSRGTGIASVPMKRGKFYWEITVLQIGDSNKEHFGIISPYNFTYSNISSYYQNSILGMTDSSTHPHSSIGIRNGTWTVTMYYENNWLALNGYNPYYVIASYSITPGDVFGFLIDVTSASFSVRKNNTQLFTINPNMAGGVMALTSSSGIWYAACASDGSNTTASVYWANFGQATFSYTPPAGFLPGIYKPTYSRLWPQRISPTPTVSLKDNNLTARVDKSIVAGAVVILGQMGKSVGKWYWEIDILGGSASNPFVFGIAYSAVVPGVYASYLNPNIWFCGPGFKAGFGAYSSYGGYPGVGENVGFALDMDAGSITMYRNGVNQGIMFTGLTAGATGPLYPYASTYTSTGGTLDGPTYKFNFGETPFKYSVPTGYNYGLYV